MMQKIPLLLFTLAIIACTQEPAYLKADFNLKYDLSKPVEVYFMPKILEEISGIHMIDKDRMACIQDEDGILFIYDLKNEKIEREIKFGPKGDYEDLEIISDDAYILRSDGTIFNMKNYLTDNEVVIIETKLRSSNNTEGLTYDKEKNSLLIACKNDPGQKPNADKAVYAFDLTDKKLKEEPFFILRNKEIKDYISQGKAWEFTVDLKNFISGDKAIFRPSAIAKHPFSNEYYLLSSVNKLMCIVGQDGKLKFVYPINYKYFNQPEGIYFSPNGDLYISNEASGSKANILKFKYNG